MNWFARMMYGRYGTDQLNLATLVLGILVSIIGRIVKKVTGLDFIYVITTAIAYILLVIMFYRMFSRNITKRRIENDKFMSFWWPIGQKLSKLIARIRESKTHRRFRCPECRQQVRVPRHRGKIKITCPKCRTQFVKRT